MPSPRAKTKSRSFEALKVDLNGQKKDRSIHSAAARRINGAEKVHPRRQTGHQAPAR